MSDDHSQYLIKFNLTREFCFKHHFGRFSIFLLFFFSKILFIYSKASNSFCGTGILLTGTTAKQIKAFLSFFLNTRKRLIPLLLFFFPLCYSFTINSGDVVLCFSWSGQFWRQLELQTWCFDADLHWLKIPCLSVNKYIMTLVVDKISFVLVFCRKVFLGLLYWVDVDDIVHSVYLCFYSFLPNRIDPTSLSPGALQSDALLSHSPPASLFFLSHALKPWHSTKWAAGPNGCFVATVFAKTNHGLRLAAHQMQV